MTKFSENFTYKIDGKKVDSVGEFYFLTQGNRYIISIDGLEVHAKSNHLKYVSTPFFLDEFITGFSSFSPRKNENVDKILAELLMHLKPKEEWTSTASKIDYTLAQKEKLEDIRKTVLNSKIVNYDNMYDILYAESEEELETILKQSMSRGTPDWNQNKKELLKEKEINRYDALKELEKYRYKINLDEAYDFKLPVSGAISHTGGTVFEKVQGTPIGRYFKFPETEQEKADKDYKNNLRLQKASDNLDSLFEEAEDGCEYSKLKSNPSVMEYLRKNKTEKLISSLDQVRGIKETDNKVDYGELDFDYIDAMALRMSKNLDKYPSKNWQKKLEIKELAKSAMRHARKILQSIDNDEESLEDHAVALGNNGMMINYQLKNK